MNELKSILLHLDASDTVAQRLRVAARLAQVHGAQLDILYAVLPAVLLVPYAFVADGQAAPLLMAAQAEVAERSRLAFETECRALGATGLRWQASEDEPARALRQRAWGADLLVFGQSEPGTEAVAGVNSDLVATVLVDSGKPGLVLPYITPLPAIGETIGATIGATILIAWKPTREAARAVSAALPLLQRAAKVHLATWDETVDGGGAVATRAPMAIETYLQRHGVAVQVHRGGRPGADIGELLLSLAADVQADLLVSGCYGHGRAREWVFGGVTRTLFRSMTLPVFMAH